MRHVQTVSIITQFSASTRAPLYKAVTKVNLNSGLGVSLKCYGLSGLALNSLESLIHFQLPLYSWQQRPGHRF